MEKNNSTKSHLSLIYYSVCIFCMLVMVSPIVLALSPRIVPQPPKMNADGYILLDFNSGYVLTEKNADDRLEPASLTKIVSSYVIADELQQGNIKLDDMVLISKKAWRMQGSRMFIEVGKQVSVEDLLNGIIIQSGNDATVALAEHVAGSEETFVSLMNQHVDNLRMPGTHFVNSTGLPDPDHYTTARDMATIAQALITNFPAHYDYYAEKEYTYNNITQYNRNKLLWRSKYVDGIKTGHTSSAGYCLVASALRDGMRLISVVMGAKSETARAAESQKLLNWGFRFFETHKLYTANEPLTEAPIWKGAKEKIALGIEDDFYVTVPRGQFKNLSAAMNINSKIVAPAEIGQYFGTVSLTLGKLDFGEKDLIALEAIEAGGIFSNLLDEIKLLFN